MKNINNVPFIAIIGGELSLFKLLAIDTLLNFCSIIVITGKISLYFILAKKDENILFDVYINASNIKLKDAIKMILNKAKEKNV